MTRQLRARAFSIASHAEASRALGELARDVQAVIDTVPEFAVYTFESQYTEPMYVTVPRAPAMIFAGRVSLATTPATPIAHGVAVEFVAEVGRVRINKIDGLMPGVTKYRFTLLLVGG